MRISKIIFLCIAIVGLSAPAWSQTANLAAPACAPQGYFNPRTHAFVPMAAPTGGDAPEAVTTAGGKFVVNFTITVKSAIGPSTPILCVLGADVFDPTNLVIEEGNVIASRSSGTAKCTVTIPYSWILSAAGSDSVTLSYVISAEAGQPSRSSAQTIVRMPIPSNGTTTTKNVNVTL